MLCRMGWQIGRPVISNAPNGGRRRSDGLGKFSENMRRRWAARRAMGSPKKRRWISSLSKRRAFYLLKLAFFCLPVAAAPTVPSLSTSMVALWTTELTLSGNSDMLLNSPSSKIPSTPSCKEKLRCEEKGRDLNVNKIWKDNVERCSMYMEQDMTDLWRKVWFRLSLTDIWMSFGALLL